MLCFQQPLLSCTLKEASASFVQPLMRTYLVLVVATAALHAADIKGTVVENQTGHPVARTAVSLESVPGGSGLRRSARTNLNGFFEFPTLPAGVYLITAARTGFATVQYGQKQWKSAGMPVTVTENDSAVLNIRLPRYGAIAGTVLDENDVGLPDHDVIAYRNTQPPRPVARAKSDDRGMFRISGLEPGSYLVRTAGKQYEDISYLPTFAKESETVSQAFPVEVEMDQQVDRADVRPATGRLFMLTVEAVPVPPNPSEPLPVTMTLASELGRETVQGNVHRFGPMPAGEYEVFSQAPLDKRPGFQGDYRKVNLNQDTTIKFVLHEEADVLFTFEGASVQSGNPGSIQVLARRKDLAGPGAEQVLKLENNRAHLSAGPWQLALAAGPHVLYIRLLGSENPTIRQGPRRWLERLYWWGWRSVHSVGQPWCDTRNCQIGCGSGYRRASISGIRRSGTGTTCYRSVHYANRRTWTIPLQRACARELSRVELIRILDR